MTPREIDREGGLTRFSLERRITILVLFLSMIVVGTVSSLRIPVELIPTGFSSPFLMVRVPWQDSPSQEVLDKVTIPLEEELNTVKGIDRLASVSSLGSSSAYMWFKQGTDMDVAYREVRDRLERAKAQFPDDIDKTYIFKEDASRIPIYMMGVALDPEVVDQYNLVQNEIVMPLERVDGVASVEANGLVEKEILIELDRERTNAAGMNIYDLATELGGDNFTMASGSVRDSGQKLLLRSVAEYDSLEMLQNRLVGSNGARLKDIAEIRYAQPDADFRVRAMSKPAVAMMVMKEGDANVRAVTQRLDKVVEKMERNPRLADTEFEVFFNQGDAIDEALGTLTNSGLIGGGIAFIVLFVFLRRFRMTMIIALGIPLSLLLGLTAMYFFGESLNLLTLLGLMICVGLLVDNSVVVAENIHRVYREGLHRRDACIKGASEVGLAITMSTLTTVVVFLPVALVEGPAQFFFLRLAIPVCVSVVASLFVALVFIPLAVYLSLSNDYYEERTKKSIPDYFKMALKRVYDATFDRMNRAYGRLLGFFLRRRIELVLLCLVMLGTVHGLFQQKIVTFVGVQEEERQGLQINVEMPETMTLEETEAWFLQAENTIESNAERLDISGWFHFHEKTDGEIQAWFSSPRRTKMKPKEITEKVVELLDVKPGMKLFVGGDEQSTNESDAAVYPVQLNGEDVELLEKTAEAVEELLVKVDGVLGAKGDSAKAPNELALVVDRTRAQQYGVSPQVVAGVVGYALRGTPLPKYREDGKEIPVRVRFEKQDRESLTELQDFMVPAGDGEFMSLAALTETRMLDVPETIVRRDSRVAESIILELEEDGKKETRERLDRLIAGLDLPEGITLGANAQVQKNNEDMAEMGYAGQLSVIFIFLLMGFLFESLILPLSIIMTIPLSFIGVAWIHALTGYDIDFLGAVAIVLLIGVVVNNGIVLIDYVNRLRLLGHSRQRAMVLGAERRFRPIMMTAITTIGGMVPLAFAGANSIGLSYTSFSLALIGGMLTATLLTLLVVPVFYTLFDDLRDIFMRSLKRATRRGRPEALATPLPGAVAGAAPAGGRLHGPQR